MNQQITIVACAHNESRHDRPLVESLLNQTNGDWKCVIFHNGPNQEMMDWILSYKDDRLYYEQSGRDSGTWGTYNRQMAITHIVDTPYMISSSVQDYYTRNAIQDISDLIEQGADLVSWQGMNHLFRYNVVNGELAFGQVDWGQWCVRTEYIKKTGIVRPSEFSSDWHTLQAILQSGQVKNYKKLNSILHIHN